MARKTAALTQKKVPTYTCSKTGTELNLMLKTVTTYMCNNNAKKLGQNCLSKTT